MQATYPVCYGGAVITQQHARYNMAMTATQQRAGQVACMYRIARGNTLKFHV
jgi:hypothetical protein